MTYGCDLNWRRLGLGMDIFWEHYYKGGWISIGPFHFWIEL